LDLRKDIPLYDMARLLRNSLHSGGVFISPTGHDRKILWNGKEYKFKHKKLIDFVSMDFLFYLYEELMEANYRVVVSNFFEKYNFIEDKYY